MMMKKTMEISEAPIPTVQPTLDQSKKQNFIQKWLENQKLKAQIAALRKMMKQQTADKEEAIKSIMELNEFFDITNDNGVPINKDMLKDIPITTLTTLLEDILTEMEKQVK